MKFEWRSEHPSTVEENRAGVLANKPRCSLCDRPFHPKYDPPRDLICRDCRDQPPTAPDPSEVLF
ncbi:hypothetical protein PBI_JEANIE_24 [Gordonia phage Jeanie]|uniref:Uncharacterized protein n=1 Tax=Gordonia phage McGonagall TaxID=1838072 RepID=A0A160DHQ2_9CAUD|nr:hypothetical protein BH764_gp24 [Gordonia phage McGonagall]ANA87602.1 hypothetical protein MCGONAGALL_24 [Gordonia phage McGonagall]ANA87629.1 hypothetical protein PBI_JEANIE_24 [Gordonia phage Jeanie]